MSRVIKDMIILFIVLLWLVLFTAIAGAVVMVSTLKSLEYSEIYEIVDGKEKIFIDLWLGPFSYRIVPKQKKDTLCK